MSRYIISRDDLDLLLELKDNVDRYEYASLKYPDIKHYEYMYHDAIDAFEGCIESFNIDNLNNQGSIYFDEEDL